jgi:hypothetical protein
MMEVMPCKSLGRKKGCLYKNAGFAVFGNVGESKIKQGREIKSTNARNKERQRENKTRR